MLYDASLFETGAEAITQAALTSAIEACNTLNWGAEGKGGDELVAAANEQLQAINTLLSACEEAAQVSFHTAVSSWFGGNADSWHEFSQPMLFRRD